MASVTLDELSTQQLSLAEQLQCLRYVSTEPNPLPKIKQCLQTREILSKVPERQR